ncbi:MAG: AtpZ/AtpI family protein [Paracoccaceae bacterium]
MTAPKDPSDRPDEARLRALEDRIAALKGPEAAQTPVADGHSQGQLAWRMVTELVAGLGIGFGIGYGLDALFGTTPWLMILFIFLGLAAGVQTMMRSAREVAARQAEAPGSGARDDETAPRDRATATRTTARDGTNGGARPAQEDDDGH